MYDVTGMNIWKDRPVNEAKVCYEDIDVAELGLSVRSFNCLRRAGCSTAADVIALMESEKGLMSVRNLGRTSCSEIMARIEELKASHPGCGTQSGSDRKKKTVIKPARKIWDTEIEAFGLSEHAGRKLKSCGINYVRDLYAPEIGRDPGWSAVRELFEKIPV